MGCISSRVNKITLFPRMPFFRRKKTKKSGKKYGKVSFRMKGCFMFKHCFLEIEMCIHVIYTIFIYLHLSESIFYVNRIRLTHFVAKTIKLNPLKQEKMLMFEVRATTIDCSRSILNNSETYLSILL